MMRGSFFHARCRFASGSFDRYDGSMRWHSPVPVRRPPGFIEPCLSTISRDRASMGPCLWQATYGSGAEIDMHQMKKGPPFPTDPWGWQRYKLGNERAELRRSGQRSEYIRR
jgi:hypothetical protein